MKDTVRVVYDAKHCSYKPYKIQVRKWWGWSTRGICDNEKDAVSVAKYWQRQIENQNKLIYIGG